MRLRTIRSHLAPLGWRAAAVMVGAALTWQVLYELERRDCRSDSADLQALCSGPLDAWVVPLTVVSAVLLVGIGVWRWVPPPRD